MFISSYTSILAATKIPTEQGLAIYQHIKWNAFGKYVSITASNNFSSFSSCESHRSHDTKIQNVISV